MVREGFGNAVLLAYYVNKSFHMSICILRFVGIR